MRRDLRAANIHIKLGGIHGEPLKLVQAAVRKQNEAPRRRRDQGESYDEVWCVIDVEQPRPHDSLERSIALAGENGIDIAYVNPCFEFWLLLHQKDCHGYLTTKDAIAKMEELKCCYKGNKDFDPRHFIGEPQQDAMKRARRLEERHQGVPRLRDRNPGTNLHVLVGKLLAQARR
ncbi:RloB family protein [Nocardiopsis algeriensis]|uniref:RloB-like protein n=1 Tax=Nocardiopsis algeriensis TaxID=1478215 RepID=A0A841IUF0_9ACTN|nr:RloB family protein [Nocardiopsis algeriensis]MBB6120175.1 hypothetical protein [Nocardiopsis algeriensis]